MELDAIPADELRALVENSITDWIEEDELERMQEVEEAEQESLRQYAEGLNGAIAVARRGDELPRVPRDISSEVCRGDAGPRAI